MDVNAGLMKEGHECDVSRLGPRHLQVGLGQSRVKDLGWAVPVMSSICEVKASNGYHPRLQGVLRLTLIL
jgi:hypothetical protein